MYKINKNKNSTNSKKNNKILREIRNINLKKIVIDSISASTIIIFVLLIFELIFYFMVTKEDIMNYLKYIDKRWPKKKILVEELFIKLLDKLEEKNNLNNSNNPNNSNNLNNSNNINNSISKIKNLMVYKNNEKDETHIFFIKIIKDKLINTFNNSVNQLIDEDVKQFNILKKKKYIELGIYIGIYIILLLAFHYYNKHNISWYKIGLILLLSYTLIILCEIFFYYKVYSKVRLIDDHKLVNNILLELKKNNISNTSNNINKTNNNANNNANNNDNNNDN